MSTSPVTPTIRDSRWRLLGVVAIMVVTALAVVVTRGTGNAQAPTAESDSAVSGSLGVTDAAFLQLTISMNTSALALFVLLQNDSPALAEVAGQLADSHRAELHDMRVVLSDGKVAEDSSLHGGHALPGMITTDNLVAVHRASATDRDVLAIELMYQHLTQGALLARGEEQSATNPAAKAMAVRIQRSRAAQLALLLALPTAPPTPRPT